MRREINVRSNCLCINASLRSLKALLKTRGIPTTAYIGINQQLREIQSKNQSTYRAITRKNTFKYIPTFSFTASGAAK